MSTTEPRRPLESLLSEEGLVTLVEQYTGGTAGEMAQRYARFRERLAMRRFVVPIAGVQGAGKSTFLNALAFQQPILPIDADETTCVPVEIRHAHAPSTEAVVHFKNGTSERVPAHEESIGRFVHNGHNPGNKLGISKVVLESNQPLLESGLVLVDLPGVGSLTASNLETTRQYLEESAGVLFMLRTVPPLTRSESIFVTTWWARLPTAFFVQNWWNDETPEEAEDGRTQNQQALQGIIQRNRLAVPLPSIHLVNAYRALEGSLKADPTLIEASGASSLLDVLARSARAWPELVRADIGSALRTDVAYALTTARERLEALSGDRATVEARMKEGQEEFDLYLTQVRQRVAQSQGEVDEILSTVRRDVSTWSRNTAAELRNTMRSKLREGITDGPRLARALDDEQSMHADALLELFQQRLLTLQDTLRERFKDTQEWRSQKFSERFTVNRAQKARFESVIPTASGIAGSIAGMRVGAALGTTLGPPGVVVGGIIGGILGGLISTWAGGKARQGVVSARARAVEPEVFAAIDQFVTTASKDALSQIKDCSEGFASSMHRWMQEQSQRHEAEREQVLAAFRLKKDEGARQRQRVTEDVSSLERLLAALPEVPQ